MKSVKKKAIVLLITLMFITSISVLILKNLKDSEKFFNVIGTDMSLTQTQITVENVNEEIMKFFKKKKDEDMKDLLSKIPEDIPFVLNDNITILLSLSEYIVENTHKINDINSTYQNDEFYGNIDYPNIFFEILKDKKKTLSKNETNSTRSISNNQQINSIINEYITKTRDTRILQIKDNFTYINIPEDTNDTYISCKYDISINNINSSVDMVFKVGDINKSKSFSFNFRKENE